MIDRDSVNLLKKHGLSFHWNDTARKWWLQKESKDGKPRRTRPMVAANRAEAESAVTAYIQKVLKDSDPKHS